MNALNENDLLKLKELLSSLANAKEDKKEAELIKEKLINFFRTTGLKHYKADGLSIRFVEERITNAFDVKILQSEYPEIYEKCHGPITKPPHLIIKEDISSVEEGE